MAGWPTGTRADEQPAHRVGELRSLGVARVSVGPGLARSVMTFIRRAAAELLDEGTYDALGGALTSAEANALFASRPPAT